MATTSISLRWSETWRVLAYSAALALAFIALQWIELALFSAFATKEVLEAIGGTAHDEERLAVEAEALAARAKAAGVPLPPGHRAATFRLGYEIGFASELLGSFVSSDAAVRERAGRVVAAHVAVAQAQARTLGLGDVAALPMRNAAEFFALAERVETDENGLGARIEARLTAVHRHLYLLGVHVGAEAAKIESSGGKFALPSETLIRRHATLAGVAPALWRPLADDARGVAPEQVLARYRAALDAIVVGLATKDADDARHLPATATETPR